MLKQGLIIAGMLFCTLTTFAIVAPSYPVWHRFPDGSWQEVYLHGDEYHHFMTTLDGRTIAGTESGLSQVMHTPSVQRAPSATLLYSSVPSKGKVRIPVVLVNFTDQSFSIDNPVESFDDLFNGSGGKNPNATGSVHDYYIASSDSALDLVYEVYGPYTLSHDMAYYGSNASGNHNIRASALIEEAAQLAVEAGVDFSVYDNNGDGLVDNISVIVAGHNEAEGGPSDAIWPHYSVISSANTYSGKRLAGYLVISEYRGSRGNIQAGIGTYCHEFGHALGLVDLYDTAEGENYTIGTWDVMCSGGYNNNGCTPPTFSAFERFWMGWLTPVQLTQPGDYRLAPIESHNEAYLVAADKHNLSASSPSPDEYFLIENRQPVGWDAHTGALVASGMLVAHITFDASAWNYNRFNNKKPLGYAIVSAGRDIQESSTEADIFPGSGSIHRWMPTLNNETALSEQRIDNIHVAEDGSIGFTYGPQSTNTIAFSTATKDTLSSPFEKKVFLEDSVMLTARLDHLTADSIVISLSNPQFAFSTDNGTTWISRGAQLRLPVVPKTSRDLAVLVRFSPTRQSCSTQVCQLTIQTDDRTRIGQYTLYGNAPRPTYIQAPDVQPFTDVASTSFTAHWEPQEDASFYYATLYYIDSNGEKQYLCRDMEREFAGLTTQAIFTDLSPATTYYFSIAAYENKGCEPHYISSREAVVSTLSADGGRKPLQVVRDENGEYTVLLPESADGSTRLNIYSHSGVLVATIPLPYGSTSVQIDESLLQKGQLYLLKIIDGKLQRKSAHGKMLFL